MLSLVSERPRAVADPKRRTVTRCGWGMHPHPLGHKPRYPKELLEAGGIEPNQRPAKQAVTPHSRRITSLQGTRVDVKGHEWTPEDIYVAWKVNPALSPFPTFLGFFHGRPR